MIKINNTNLKIWSTVFGVVIFSRGTRLSCGGFTTDTWRERVVGKAQEEEAFVVEGRTSRLRIENWMLALWPVGKLVDLIEDVYIRFILYAWPHVLI